MLIPAPDSNPDELAQLRAENARLIQLLESHGIAWRAPTKEVVPASTSSLSNEEKVALFRRLFRGRSDVYALRWENRAGKNGYSPACANEWKLGICEKPRIACAQCPHRQLLPITDQVIFDHLAGRHTIGTYPLLSDDTCHFLAVDFDESDWREDVRAFIQSCRELDVPHAVEISRSGSGAHVWIFFADVVSARDARQLGSALISHACARTRQLKLNSYDRLFPNQDTLPNGGFGNLIALPLQKHRRARGATVFVDDDLRAYPDQWEFLSRLQPMDAHEIESVILRVTRGAHPLDVSFLDSEDGLDTPWKSSIPKIAPLPGPLPASLNAVLADRLYIEKVSLVQPLANRLIRLATFSNPEFHQAQKLRLPIWNKPRLISCAEQFPQHIALPRGCLDAMLELLREHNIGCQLQDERCNGEQLELFFNGQLRADQAAAVEDMLRFDHGILCAPTAFGKTIVAAALMAHRNVNTLILVHRKELLKQWHERLQSFLVCAGHDATLPLIGRIGGGTFKPSGKIDIALMQSLHRRGETNAIVENYRHVIIDECHHLSAVSFEAILKRVRARYILGLTATPVRRDGKHPILFMQCGPIRHTAARPSGMPQRLEVMAKFVSTNAEFPGNTPIQTIFRELANDNTRAHMVVDAIIHAYRQGRKILALSERTDHLNILHEKLQGQVETLFLLHGRQPKQQRTDMLIQLGNLSTKAPRVLLASGRLVGEGFDHPPLDTLILTMPISWKGTLQQYAGRLHREQVDKHHVSVIDFIDTGHPSLLRMWQRRQRGYRAMGYRILTGEEQELDLWG